MYTTVQESISILLKRLKASHCSSLTLITIIVAAQPHDGPLQYSLIACMHACTHLTWSDFGACEGPKLFPVVETAETEGTPNSIAVMSVAGEDGGSVALIASESCQIRIK